MPQLSHPSDRLHPAEDFLDPLALLLAHRVAGMPCRPSVNRTLASLIVLRNLRSGVHVPGLFHKILGVVSFIGSDGNWLIPLECFRPPPPPHPVPLCRWPAILRHPPLTHFGSPSAHARYS